jgi:hypothetical protein
MTPVRGIPTSRAFWELKAEQVMNRVFAPEPSIELEIVEPEPATPIAAEVTAATATTTLPSRSPQPPGRHPQARKAGSSPRPPRVAARPAQPGGGALPADRKLLIGGFGLMTLLLAGTTLTGLRIWNHQQQALQQERNMLLIERLRNLPSAGGASVSADAKVPGATASGEGPELPPPPPDEPWMQELATLPSSSAPPARVLQVPMSSRVSAPAPAAQGRAATPSAPPPVSSGGGGGSMPTLVGVIQVPGGNSSAIFQVGGSSASASVGETIGSTGWRLRSASGDTAVIERGGEQARVNISSGF